MDKCIGKKLIDIIPFEEPNYIFNWIFDKVVIDDKEFDLTKTKDIKEIMKNEKMKEKIETYYKLYDELELLAEHILHVTIHNYPSLIDNDIYSPTYEEFKIEDGEFIIRYYDHGYDLYDANYISIPLSYMFNNTYEEYLEQKHLENIDRKSKYDFEQQEREKQQRMEMYQKLREEFENEV